MEQETRLFAGGLHNDFDPQNQPKNTYRDATNIVRELDGSIRSEIGSLHISTLPSKIVVGSCVLGEYSIWFFYDEGGLHEIGYSDEQDVYTSCLVSSDLNFKLDRKISSKAEVDYKGSKIVYFVDGVNPDRCLNLDNPPSLDIANQLKLDVSSLIPKVTLRSIGNNGSLPTGIYQFQVRLLTGSTNTTSPSLMTNPIPIVNEVGNSQMVDGAAPQTSSFKSINLDLTNLDVNFKNYEVVVTTYEGLSNVPRSYIVGRRPITSSTSSFTLSSMSQVIEEITIDEVTVEPVRYESSRFIDSRDGYLLRANLTAREEGSSFQNLANAAVVKYVVKEVNYSESININAGGTAGSGEIIDSGTSTHEDGYHKEEFTVNFKGYQRGEVYDFAIAPKYKNGTTGNAYHIPARDNNIERADTITKHLGTFRSEYTYPNGFGFPSGNIRYHVFPQPDQEPVFANGKVRVLGVSVTVNLDLLPEDQRSEIDGWILVRQRRKEGSRKILAQGILNPMLKTGGNQDLLMVSPFNGKPDFDYAKRSTYLMNHIAFLSPETIFNSSVPMADRVVKIGVAKGTGYLAGYNEKQATALQDKFVNIFMDFNTYSYSLYNDNTSPIDKSTIQTIPAEQANFRWFANNITQQISTKGSNGYLFFKTNNPVSVWEDDNTKDMIQGRPDVSYFEKSSVGQSGDDDIVFQYNGQVRDHDQTNYRGDVKRMIYNLVSDSKLIYGDLTSGDYIYVGESSTGSLEVYNGDTFINRVAIMSTTSGVQTGSEQRDLADKTFRTLSYLFLESTINTTFRHYVNPQGDEQGTVPYYPKRKVLFSQAKQDGLFQISSGLGHSKGYNQQYSFDNGIKKYFPKPLLLETELTDFSNRVIYSERGIEGEQFNAKRLVLPNNYHDIPRDKGPIVEMFTHSGSYFIKTTRSIYQAAFNDRTAIASTSGEVILGNGGLFPVPSKEIYASDGGYAGGEHLSIYTPFGRFWIDENQGKLFMFSESIDEVSIPLRKFFLSQGRRTNTVLDNYNGTYDYVNRRLLLSCNDWTLSYCPELKSFSSYHDYKTTHMLSNGKRSLIVKGRLVEEMGKGDLLTYFGENYLATTSVVFNDNPIITKVFDNLVIQSLDVHDTIECSTVNQGSGQKSLFYNNEYEEYDQSRVTVKFKNGNYQLAIPRANDMRLKAKYLVVKLMTIKDVHLKYVTMLYRVSR